MQFRSLTDIVSVKRSLGGAFSVFGRRRVFRGIPVEEEGVEEEEGAEVEEAETEQRGKERRKQGDDEEEEGKEAKGVGETHGDDHAAEPAAAPEGDGSVGDHESVKGGAPPSRSSPGRRAEAGDDVSI